MADLKRSLNWSYSWILCDQGRPRVLPPSITRAWPVTQLDSLLASQSVALAISAGSPALGRRGVNRLLLLLRRLWDGSRHRGCGCCCRFSVSEQGRERRELKQWQQGILRLG